MSSSRRILVPWVRSGKDLSSIHYALSLASRLKAHIYILQQSMNIPNGSTISDYADDELLDLINSARQMGLVVSHHITNKDMKQEIVSLVKEERIGFLVFSLNNAECKRYMHEVRPLVSSQIIQVKDQKSVANNTNKKAK